MLHFLQLCQGRFEESLHHNSLPSKLVECAMCWWGRSFLRIWSTLASSTQDMFTYTPGLRSCMSGPQSQLWKDPALENQQATAVYQDIEKKCAVCPSQLRKGLLITLTITHQVLQPKVPSMARALVSFSPLPSIKHYSQRFLHGMGISLFQSPTIHQTPQPKVPSMAQASVSFSPLPSTKHHSQRFLPWHRHQSLSVPYHPPNTAAKGSFHGTGISLFQSPTIHQTPQPKVPSMARSSVSFILLPGQIWGTRGWNNLLSQ